MRVGYVRIVLVFDRIVVISSRILFDTLQKIAYLLTRYFQATFWKNGTKQTPHPQIKRNEICFSPVILIETQ